MNTTQSRRGFLAVLSAGAAATVAPAALAATLAPLPETAPSALAPAVAAAAEPALMPSLDEGLMELVREYLKVDAERKKFDKVTERIDNAWEAKHPMPDALRRRPGDCDLDLPRTWASEEALNDSGYCISPRSIEEMRLPEWWETVTLDLPEGLQYAHSAEGLQSYVPSPEARARADEIVAAYDEWWPKRSHPGSRKREARSDQMFNRLSRLETKINKKPARTIVGLLAKIRVACMAAVFDDQDATIQVALRDALKMGDDLGWPGCDDGFPNWRGSRSEIAPPAA